MVSSKRFRRVCCRQSGFTLVEVVVALAILGVSAAMALGGLLFGMTQAQRASARAQGGAWMQAELDYLRSQGFAGLADDVAAGTRTLTQTGGYTTYGSLAEPQIPPGADRANVRVTDVAGMPLRLVTAALFDDPGSIPALVSSTYVTPLAPVSPPP